MLLILTFALLGLDVFAEYSSSAGHVMFVGRVDDRVEEPLE
jgi:hypothetical protein